MLAGQISYSMRNDFQALGTAGEIDNMEREVKSDNNA